MPIEVSNPTSAVLSITVTTQEPLSSVAYFKPVID